MSQFGDAGGLSASAGVLFAEAPLVMRTMQWLRPYICPFELVLPLVPEGARVLDIGCGGGLVLGLLAAQGKKISGLGVDTSAPAIAAAQRMAPKAREFGSALEFRLTKANDPLPEGPFDVVSFIDVMHHVPGEARARLFEAAVARVGSGGRLIYKDMVARPWWRVAGNRLHDLVIARQMISEVPLGDVQGWASSLGLEASAVVRANRYWYGHELVVFERRAGF